jgi:predicted DNA-binding transcriptional regulator AlpA
MLSTGKRGTRQEPPLISVKETAQLLQVSPVMVYRRYHAGQFPGRKIGRKFGLYRPFVNALYDAICSGRPVNVEEFAATWASARAASVSEAVA